MVSAAACLVLLAAAALPVQVSLEPKSSVLHQQVQLHVEVTHPVVLVPRWEEPTFDGFWPESLPSEGGQLERDASGTAIRTTRYRRALFPTRTGALVVAPSRIWLRDREGVEHAFEVPGAELRVEPLPAAGQPADFSGLVGELRMSVAPSSGEVELGGSWPVRFAIEGTAALWRQPAPALSAQGLEVFAGKPELERSERRGLLTSRATGVLELVPARSGTLALGPLRLTYYDPARRSYRVAESAPLELRVLPARAVPPLPPTPEPTPELPLPDASGDARTGRMLLGLGLLVALLALGAAVRARSRRQSAPASLPEPARVDLRQLLAEAERAGTAGERVARLAQAVRSAAGARHGFDPSALTAAELGVRSGDGEAAALLSALDALRFTGREGVAGELQERVRRYVAAASDR